MLLIISCHSPLKHIYVRRNSKTRRVQACHMSQQPMGEWEALDLFTLNMKRDDLRT